MQTKKKISLSDFNNLAVKMDAKQVAGGQHEGYPTEWTECTVPAIGCPGGHGACDEDHFGDWVSTC